MSEDRTAERLLPVREQEVGLSKTEPLVRARAKSRLQTSSYHDLHLVSCEFHEGVLTLRGRVPTFHLKQVAQTLIRDLDGVGEINNRLEVAASCDDNEERRTDG